MNEVAKLESAPSKILINEIIFTFLVEKHDHSNKKPVPHKDIANRGPRPRRSIRVQNNIGFVAKQCDWGS